MAVKRKSLAEKRKAIDEAIKNINKREGRTVIGTLKDEEIAEKLVIDYIPTPSLKVNSAAGGGVPRAKFSLVSGASDTGKSMLMLETIAKNIKEDIDFTGAWIESENSLEESSIKMFGITDEDLKDRFIFMPTEDMSAEAVLDAVIRLAHTGVDMIVINSLKCLTPKKELADSMEDQNVALQARINATFMRKVIPILATTGTALVAIQHYTTMIGGYGAPKAIGGGMQIKYNNVLTMELSKGYIESGTILAGVRDQYMPIELKITKNHCITDKNVYVKVSYFVKYGKGIDTKPEVIDAIFENGLVEKKGAWIREFNEEGKQEKGNERVLPDGTVAKWNGMAKFMEYLDSNPDYFEYLKNKVEGNITTESLGAEEIEELEKQNELEEQELQELESMIDEATEVTAEE